MPRDQYNNSHIADIYVFVSIYELCVNLEEVLQPLKHIRTILMPHLDTIPCVGH